jgi:hypothetical protein
MAKFQWIKEKIEMKEGKKSKIIAKRMPKINAPQLK